MITYHGDVSIPSEVLNHAEPIKKENYKTNTPTKFQVRSLIGGKELMSSLSSLIGVPRERLDFVYFSVCKGAEPHIDLLPKFEDTTYVIPVILPQGKSIITAESDRKRVHIGGVYQFDHNKVHSMELEDTKSGCVVIMVAIKKDKVNV
jgi:hypothetical protein